MSDSPPHDRIYREICDRASIGIVCLSAELRIEYWNEWLTERTGIAADAARGRTFEELFPGFHHPRFAWAAQQVLDFKSPQVLSQALNRYLVPIRLTGAARHGMTMMQQNVQMYPLSAEDGKARLLVTILDVTEAVVRSSALAELAQQLREQTTRDPLTGAFNRRFMWEWLGGQLQLASRAKQPMACLMIDIDHFKRINDDLGHEAGDAVLKHFSSLVDQHLRGSDILVRYGGEEFVVLLPSCDLPRGIEVARRVRAAVAASTVPPLGPGQLTCSIGVGCWNGDAMATGAELMREADRQLYRAKNGGRNQVSP